jgi:hypothetical protein
MTVQNPKVTIMKLKMIAGFSPDRVDSGKRDVSNGPTATTTGITTVTGNQMDRMSF